MAPEITAAQARAGRLQLRAASVGPLAPGEPRCIREVPVVGDNARLPIYIVFADDHPESAVALPRRPRLVIPSLPSKG